MDIETAIKLIVILLLFYLFYKRVHNRFFHNRRKKQRRKIRDRRVNKVGRRSHRNGEVEFKHRDYRFHESDRRSGVKTRRRHKRRAEDRHGANVYH